MLAAHATVASRSMCLTNESCHTDCVSTLTPSYDRDHPDGVSWLCNPCCTFDSRSASVESEDDTAAKFDMSTLTFPGIKLTGYLRACIGLATLLAG